MVDQLFDLKNNYPEEIINYDIVKLANLFLDKQLEIAEMYAKKDWNCLNVNFELDQYFYKLDDYVTEDFFIKLVKTLPSLLKFIPREKQTAKIAITAFKESVNMNLDETESEYEFWADPFDVQLYIDRTILHSDEFKQFLIDYGYLELLGDKQDWKTFEKRFNDKYNVICFR